VSSATRPHVVRIRSEALHFDSKSDVIAENVRTFSVERRGAFSEATARIGKAAHNSRGPARRTGKIFVPKVSLIQTMTIINRSHRFVYIHVPKTGGTSLKIYLERFCRPGDICLAKGIHAGETGARNVTLKKHSCAKDVREYLGKPEFERYFRFSVVRNPFERANSIFHFLKFKFRSWPRSEIMNRFENLEDMVVSGFFRHPGPGGIFEPQTSWLMLGGRLAVNFLARLETLEVDIAEIFHRLSLGEPVLPIARKNASRATADDEGDALFTPAAVDAIRCRYAADFEMLGYSPDPAVQTGRRPETDLGNPQIFD
jgi:hypothetical protein